MKSILTYLRACIYIICILLLSASCTHRAEDQMMDEAETLMAEFADSAYCILQGIDLGLLPEGSEIEARYALLCTQAQYKCYADIPNDSLISVAVDYYEAYGDPQDKFYAYLYQGIVRYQIGEMKSASASLLRAMANSDGVSDHYAMGQMYTYLSLINSYYHCSDDAYYARKAYNEYMEGQLIAYSYNSLSILATTHIHKLEFDSCRLLLDSVLNYAMSEHDEFLLQDALSLKLQYAVMVDSMELAERLSMRLLETNTALSTRDIANLAILYADRQCRDSADMMLSIVKENCRTINDTVDYYVKALAVYRSLHEDSTVISFMTLLLDCEDQYLDEGFSHTSLAIQNDYTEFQLAVSKAQTRLAHRLLLLSILLVLSLSVILVMINRHRKIQIRLQESMVRELQMELKQYEKQIADGVRNLKSEEFVSQIRQRVTESKGLATNEWEILNSLFSHHLPLFESSLRSLTPLNETEWRICMLLKLSISPGDIAILMNKTSGTISSARSRLYKKVFKKKGSTSDWDSFVTSL